MKIEAFSIDLSSPLQTASGSIHEREGVLLSITVDGYEGIGESTPLPGWTESLQQCKDVLRTISEEQSEIDENTLICYDEVLSNAPAARHGLSLAILDARSKHADVPLYHYLNGENSKKTIPVNATVGDGPPKDTAEAVSEASEAGFDTIKIKVGVRSIEEDCARLDTVRKRCPAVNLRVDANGVWTYQQAVKALHQFKQFNISYLEQPLAPDALEEIERLQKKSPIPIALDETIHTYDIKHIEKLPFVNYIIIKPMSCGGIDRAHFLAQAARQQGIEPIITTTFDFVYARAAAVHLAASLSPIEPCGLATGEHLKEGLNMNPVPVQNGKVVVPHGKGNIPRL